MLANETSDGFKAVNLAAVTDGRAADFLKRLSTMSADIKEASLVHGCLSGGYAPNGYELADFSIIRKNGLFHLFHIPRIAGNCCVHPCNEHWFGHAVSCDLDTWEILDPVLSTEPANYFESSHIWAPFVFSGTDADYMFYSGLSSEPSQVIAFAVSTDPQLKVWSRNPGNPLIPIEGFDWHFRNSSGHIRHGRDPHVVKVGSHFLLAYTTMHSNGCPCVGGMVSDDLRKWDDIGPILYRPFDPAPWMPESVNIQSLPDGRWVLIPSVSPGLEYYISGDPHVWHGSKPESITYLDGPSDQPLGLEVMLRDDCAGKWLTAYFEMSANRLFIGELDIHAAPWSLKRITNPQQLAAWSGRFAE